VTATPDTQIAGIAVSRGAAIATRNVRHFPGLSVPVINPWGAP
jgi:toxin FitB